MKRLVFFAEGIKHLMTTGTIVRSSPALCKGMVSDIDFSKVKTIVELGAGDGVLTKVILENMSQDAKLFSFEVLPAFIPILEKIDDDRLSIEFKSAELLDEVLKSNNISEVDVVISALPFAVFPDDVIDTILNRVEESLKPNGQFIQMHYSLKKKKKYDKLFGKGSKRWVPNNIPPAWVLMYKKTN